MSRRAAIEVRIVQFFRTAELPVARAVLALCKSSVDERGEAPAAAPRQRRKRAARKALGESPLLTPPAA